jgi:hypothetical protein
MLHEGHLGVQKAPLGMEPVPPKQLTHMPYAKHIGHNNFHLHLEVQLTESLNERTMIKRLAWALYLWYNNGFIYAKHITKHNLPCHATKHEFYFYSRG